jgi:hypothetical protein
MDSILVIDQKKLTIGSLIIFDYRTRLTRQDIWLWLSMQGLTSWRYGLLLAQALL